MRACDAHRVLALLLATALPAACSFFVQGPPNDYRPDTHGAPACNRCARGSLSLDVIGAIWGASFAAVMNDEEYEHIDYVRGFVVVGAVGAAIHVGAFLYGWRQTVRCRDAQDRFIRWADIRPVEPAPLSPVDCNALRREAEAEADPAKRFELLREIRARCDTSPPGSPLGS